MKSFVCVTSLSHHNIPEATEDTKRHGKGNKRDTKPNYLHVAGVAGHLPFLLQLVNYLITINKRSHRKVNINNVTVQKINTI